MLSEEAELELLEQELTLNFVEEDALWGEYEELWEHIMRYGNAKGVDFVPDIDHLVDGTYLSQERSLIEKLAEAAMILGIPREMGYDDLEKFYIDVVTDEIKNPPPALTIDTAQEYERVEDAVWAYLNRHQIFHRVGDELKHAPIKGVW